MTLFEVVEEMCRNAGLSLDTSSARTSNQVDQFQRMESPAGILVRRLEKHYKVKPEGQLGVRVRRLHMAMSPLGKATLDNRPVILFSGHYNRPMCRLHPELLFVFGDNRQRVGEGGQACIRPESNVFGVATKRAPSNGPNAFFRDGVPDDMGAVCFDLLQLEAKLKEGNRIVLPITPEERISLGTGLSQLPYHAPLIYMMIESWFERIKRTHRFTTVG